MSKIILKLTGHVAKQAACRYVNEAPEGYVITIAEPSGTLDQNAAQWPYLEAFAKQKQLCINGQMQWVTADDWKDVLTGWLEWRNANGGIRRQGNHASPTHKQDGEGGVQHVA